MRQDQVEGVGRVRLVLGGGDVDVRHVLMRADGAVMLDVKGEHVRAVLQQVGGIRAQARAVHEDGGVLRRPPAPDHGEAALLTGPPDIAGRAALGEFVGSVGSTLGHHAPASRSLSHAMLSIGVGSTS